MLTLRPTTVQLAYLGPRPKGGGSTTDEHSRRPLVPQPSCGRKLPHHDGGTDASKCGRPKVKGIPRTPHEWVKPPAVDQTPTGLGSPTNRPGGTCTSTTSPLTNGGIHNPPAVDQTPTGPGTEVGGSTTHHGTIAEDQHESTNEMATNPEQRLRTPHHRTGSYRDPRTKGNYDTGTSRWMERNITQGS